ncbi:MAG TPA: CBS domain-containing protein [Anaerolineales bacterium]|nr:CBS domain-containing protein [Anaerolineales bacterium]
MAYLSDLMGRPVTDVDGELVGRLDDLIASVPSGGSHPVIKAVVVKRGGEVLTIPSAEVAVLVAPSIPLNRRLQELAPYQPGPRDMHLVQDVLDKQIIDTNGVRVVRVNDLELTRIDAQYVVANVDFGTLGLLRRLGMARSVQRLAALFGKRLHPGLVSWEQVELLPGDPALRLKVPGEKITELHPADLAEIISDLTRSEGGQLLASLDVRTVADTLESVEPEFQASLVAAMSDEKVADVLEEMAPDEAADLLAELPQDRSRDLLLLMEDSEAADVRRLLAYPEDTAGGIMTTDVISFPPDLTAEAALARLRQMAPEADTLHYVYVVDGERRLMGGLSLGDLVLGDPKALLKDLMYMRVVSVTLLDSQDEVAQAISKYNLLAVPVVDDQQKLQGIVTVDDALDKVIPTKWKKRMPRLYH